MSFLPLPLPRPRGRRFDLLAIGEPLYEFAQESDGRFRAGFGGDTSNAAIAAARLGCRTAYLTLLGQDMFGDAIADLWRREGVETRHVRRHPAAPSGVYVVTQGPNGHTFSYLRKGSAASLLQVSDIPPVAIADAAILHASGISQAISKSAAAAVAAALAMARQAGTLVAYDTNFRPRLWPLERARPVIHAAAAQADLLKTSLEDGMALTGLSDVEAIAEFYLDLGAKAVVVTLGADGVLGCMSGQSHRLEPHKVKTIDATGAGDAFMGALLAELVRHIPFHAALIFANAAAALSTQGLGAVAPLPTRREVENFLAEMR
jgi:2-dehydro-3-deoxygluconokinase